MARPHIAASVRLILAMFRLYAGIEAQFGKAILDILKKQYPDQDVSVDPASVGHKLMAIARKQLQGSDTDSMDAIQNLLTYLTTGSKYETNDDGVIQRDEDGEPILRKSGKPWNFAKDFASWEDALKAIYSNLRTTALSGSLTKTKRKKTERGIDDAFGRRDDSGGMSDGESRMPTPDDTALGKALDDHAAIREFYGVIDDYLPELKASLSPDTLKLFDLIFEDDVGSFGSDIKENMGQATALKEKYPDLFEKNAKRWSGFVGDLRKKLLDGIWDFIEKHMTPGDYDVLKETFFADVDPSAVRKKERDKTKGKEDYQRGIDERKLARLKGKGELDPKDQKEFDRLSKKLKDAGVDVDAIKADSAAPKKGKQDEESASQQASMMVMAQAVAAEFSRHPF